MNIPSGITYNQSTGAVEVSSHDLHAAIRAAEMWGCTKYVPAPMLYYTGEIELTPKGEVLGVWCGPEEEVRWLWNDDTIYGYEIVMGPLP